MRARTLRAAGWSALALIMASGHAYAQPGTGVSYEPPPVEYAGPSDSVRPAPIPADAAAVEDEPPARGIPSRPRLRVDIDP